MLERIQAVFTAFINLVENKLSVELVQKELDDMLAIDDDTISNYSRVNLKTSCKLFLKIAVCILIFWLKLQDCDLDSTPLPRIKCFDIHCA